MKEITEKYKKEVLENKELDKQIKVLQKRKAKLKTLKMNLFKCPNRKCGALFEEVKGLSSPYNEYWLPSELYTDKDIKIVPTHEKERFTDWTTWGWTISEASVSEVYFICPKCGKKTLVRKIRNEQGRFIEDRDA